MLPTVAEHVRNVQSVVRARNPHAIARPYIADSWIRCSNIYELDPAAPRMPAAVTQSELESRRGRLEDLVQVARIEMVNLYQQLAGSGYALVLTDRDGVVLDVFGDPDFVQTASRGGLTAGAIWSERFQGTNGMGTCIVERTPIMVHHTEHFFARNIGLTCSASPIFNHDGELVAVLDASGHSRLAQQHTLALVNMSAQMIENRTFMRRLQDRHLLRFHSRPEFLGTLSEGVLAFDACGRLIAANRPAAFQLGVASQSDLHGRHMHELFGVSLASICEISNRKSYHPTPVFSVKSGSRFFAIAQRPAALTGRTAFVAGGLGPEDLGDSPPGALAALEALDTGDPHLSRVIAQARRALQGDVALLLQGESGVGKSVLASALHAAGARADKPFLEIDCANLPALQRDESGAADALPTWLVKAQGGTIFFDSVDELSTEQQGRLLKLFDAIERERLPQVLRGNPGCPGLDIGLISASRTPLAEAVRKGLMREDFYYRIAGLTLELPSLRERTDLRTLIERLVREMLKPNESVDFDDPLLQALARFRWPGNIRQLRNVLRNLLYLRDDNRLRLADAPLEIRNGSHEAAGTTDPGNLSEDAVRSGDTPALEFVALNPLDAAERQALLRELELHHWGISKVARSLGMSRNTLYRKMERLKLRGLSKRA